MNQIFRLSSRQPALKFNLSDVISTRVGQLLISNNGGINDPKETDSELVNTHAILPLRIQLTLNREGDLVPLGGEEGTNSLPTPKV